MSVLSDELLNDPILRGYSTMTNLEAANNLNNVIDRTAKGGITGMTEYLLNNKNRTNTGTDLSVSAILGRLHQVADSVVGSNPFGADVVYDVTVPMKHAAQSFLDLLYSPHTTEIDFDGANLPYAKCTDAGIWKSADVTALKGLSINQQSRAQELGLPRVREGHVQEARS